MVVTLACAAGAHADEKPVDLGRVDVIGTTPLPGLGTPLEQIPSNVQNFGARDLSRQRTGGVAEFLDLNANSVNLNSPTGNAFQPDVSFRGFTASSLLGTPQGLSVFQDGVRINEAFADIVNWDLIPKNAIASMQLLPGSNPVFGLNTLGGALTIHMKDGFTYNGAEVSVSGGSFARTEIAAEAGGNDGTLGWFAAVDGVRDDGYRDHSAARIGRLYARVDGQVAGDQVNVGLSLADNHIEGTQALPVSMLDNPRQPYTWPDTTEQPARVRQRQLAACVCGRYSACRQRLLPQDFHQRRQQQRQRRLLAARAFQRGGQPAHGGNDARLGHVATTDAAAHDRRHRAPAGVRRRLRRRHDRLRAKRPKPQPSLPTARPSAPANSRSPPM
jgi:hypothetical protein